MTLDELGGEENDREEGGGRGKGGWLEHMEIPLCYFADLGQVSPTFNACYCTVLELKTLRLGHGKGQIGIFAVGIG